MMIEYLEKLVEERQLEKALAYAEQLLLAGDRTPRELLVINCALLTARLYLEEYYGAMLAGQLAMNLARDLNEWDYFGQACVNLGVACGRLRLFEDTQKYLYEYLVKLPLYRTSGRFEPLAWYNLGIAHHMGGRNHEAASAFSKALQVANRQGMDRQAHGIRQGLIEAYLEIGELSPVPGILAKCLHYIRHNSDAPELSETRLWHFHLRAKFAVKTQRYGRAVTVAAKGLREAQDSPVHQYDMYMVLAEATHLMGDTRRSLRYALHARVCAMRCHRYDLEYQAADFMYELTRSNPEAFSNLELGSESGVDSALHPDTHVQ